MGKKILVGNALPILNKKQTSDKREQPVSSNKKDVIFKPIMLSDLVLQCKEHSRIFIVGFNGGIITSLLNDLGACVKDHKFLNTNDFINTGDFNTQISECMRVLKKHSERCVMGGVQMFRVIRRVESFGEDRLRPNVVVRCFGTINHNQITMVKGLETMWSKYLDIVKEPLPLFLDYFGAEDV